MARGDWENSYAKCQGMLLVGKAIEELDEWGNPIVDAALLLLMNARYDRHPFVLPLVLVERGRWEMIVDTRTRTGGTRSLILQPGEPYALESRSLALFQFELAEEET